MLFWDGFVDTKVKGNKFRITCCKMSFHGVVKDREFRYQVFFKKLAKSEPKTFRDRICKILTRFGGGAEI